MFIFDVVIAVILTVLLDKCQVPFYFYFVLWGGVLVSLFDVWYITVRHSKSIRQLDREISYLSRDMYKFLDYSKKFYEGIFKDIKSILDYIEKKV